MQASLRTHKAISETVEDWGLYRIIIDWQSGLKEIICMCRAKCVAFQEHECKLTHEIMELIDREADLMMRGVKECNLDGLRKRICTLFLQYIKTPFFNPEVARLLKVMPLSCHYDLVMITR